MVEYTADVTPNSGATEWFSDNVSVIKVDATGHVLTGRAGNATINATHFRPVLRATSGTGSKRFRHRFRLGAAGGRGYACAIVLIRYNRPGYAAAKAKKE
jgi:hypothetical protein